MNDTPELTQEDAEAALMFLAGTDEQYGKLQTQVKATLFLADQTRYNIFLSAEGKNIEERKAKSVIDQVYTDRMRDHYKAEKDMRILQAERKTAELKIDLWRSINAARRTGG